SLAHWAVDTTASCSKTASPHCFDCRTTPIQLWTQARQRSGHTAGSPTGKTLRHPSAMASTSPQKLPSTCARDGVATARLRPNRTRIRALFIIGLSPSLRRATVGVLDAEREREPEPESGRGPRVASFVSAFPARRHLTGRGSAARRRSPGRTQGLPREYRGGSASVEERHVSGEVALRELARVLSADVLGRVEVEHVEERTIVRQDRSVGELGCGHVREARLDRMIEARAEARVLRPREVERKVARDDLDVLRLGHRYHERLEPDLAQRAQDGSHAGGALAPDAADQVQEHDAVVCEEALDLLEALAREDVRRRPLAAEHVEHDDVVLVVRRPEDVAR